MNVCETFACARRGCQSTIHLHHDVEERLRRTHETFYCPAGHGQYFAGKTDEEKRIAELEHKNENLARVRDRFREFWEDTSEDRDAWKLRARTCPFGCGFRVLRKRTPDSISAYLAFHLIEEHGARMPEPVEEKDEALA